MGIQENELNLFVFDRPLKFCEILLDYKLYVKSGDKKQICNDPA